MAGYFPNEWLDELISKNDIVEIISRFVDLKQKGSRFWGCCPFHNEKTPSFNVNPEKQFYYCFGCGEGGGVIQFIMKYDKLNFTEAVEYLANRANISIPTKIDDNKSKEFAKMKQKYFEICKLAALFFWNNLKTNNGSVLEYFKKRHLKKSAITVFGLGYAQNSDNALQKHLLAKGYSIDDLLDVGLVKKNGEKYSDVFRDRLIFPIIDIYGNVIAFGGRIIDNNIQPKYINSPDSKIYNKKRHLYGLNVARKNKEISKLILVEGYMDVITLTSYGIVGAVASLGTSLTAEQARLIKRFYNEVIISYDGDSAGINAAVRASKILLEANIKTRILYFNDKIDPDEYIQINGIEKYEKLIEEALLPHVFEMKILKEKYDISKDKDRKDFAEDCLKVLSKVENSLDKEDGIKYLHALTGYSYDILIDESNKIYSLTEKRNKNVINRNNINNKTIQIAGFTKEAEKMLIKIIMNGYTIDDRINSKDFELFSDLYELILGIKKENIDINETNILNLIDDSEISSKLIEIINIEIDFNGVEEIIDDCIRVLKINKEKKKLENLKAELNNIENDRDKKSNVLQQIKEAQIEINLLKHGNEKRGR